MCSVHVYEYWCWVLPRLLRSYSRLSTLYITVLQRREVWHLVPSAILTNFLQLFVHSAGSSVQAKFQPILRAYIVSDFRENELLTRRVSSPVLFDYDLAALPGDTYLKLTYDQGTKEYKIVLDPEYKAWLKNAGYDDESADDNWVFFPVLYYMPLSALTCYPVTFLDNLYVFLLLKVPFGRCAGLGALNGRNECEVLWQWLWLGTSWS